MSRIPVTVTRTEETTLFLDPAEFRGLNDLDAIVAINRELGHGMWDPEQIAEAADRVLTEARKAAGERT